MSSVRFQLILRQPVFPEHFLLLKLKELIEPKQVEVGDYDLDYLKGAICINYYTEYPNLQRQILCFTIDFSILEPLGEGALKELILEFGQSFMQCNQVEGIFRFEDDFTLSEIIKLHREIYEIELKVREVLTYILSYNLPDNSLFDFIKDFDGPKFANDKIRKDTAYREALWAEFMENDLFYISFTEYGYFNKPRPLDPKMIFDFISSSDDFAKLRERVGNRGVSDDVNEAHRTFISNLSTNLDPIEKLRNEIMHNRIVKENDRIQQFSSFNKAKEQILNSITEFWANEALRNVNGSKQIIYILDTVLSTAVKEGEVYKYYDLDFEEQVAESKEELKAQIIEIITYHFPIETDLDTLIDEKLIAKLN